MVNGSFIIGSLARCFEPKFNAASKLTVAGHRDSTMAFADESADDGQRDTQTASGFSSTVKQIEGSSQRVGTESRSCVFDLNPNGGS